jgi:YkoY family integral membrane protein
MFGQTFDFHDLAVVALLVVLEGVLSIDNALVLGLLARRLPKPLQKKALTYGLVGAFLFRFISIALAAWLLHWRWVKLLGGGYLVFIAVRHLFFECREEHPEHFGVGPDREPALIDHRTGQPLAAEDCDASIRQRVPISMQAAARVGAKQFWMTVLVIEVTDIAFAIDSILAAIALVGPAPLGHTGAHPKLWVVLTGGMLGVVLMRYAAVMFIKLLEAFPRFETAAYLLVTVIGLKLLIDFAANSADHERVNFHSPASPAFWALWVLMLVCFSVGFLPKRSHPNETVV